MLTLVGFAVITAGYLCLLLYPKYARRKRFRTWVPVAASLEVAPLVRRDGLFGANRLVRAPYFYQVNGIRYEGALEMYATSESHAFQLAGLLQGKSVTVLYDPTKPARSQPTLPELNKTLSSISPDTPAIS